MLYVWGALQKTTTAASNTAQRIWPCFATEQADRKLLLQTSSRGLPGDDTQGRGDSDDETDRHFVPGSPGAQECASARATSSHTQTQLGLLLRMMS
jgi:hypothetical protein